MFSLATPSLESTLFGSILVPLFFLVSILHGVSPFLGGRSSAVCPFHVETGRTRAQAALSRRPHAQQSRRPGVGAEQEQKTSRGRRGVRPSTDCRIAQARRVCCAASSSLWHGTCLVSFGTFLAPFSWHVVCFLLVVSWVAVFLTARFLLFLLTSPVGFGSLARFLLGWCVFVAGPVADGAPNVRGSSLCFLLAWGRSARVPSLPLHFTTSVLPCQVPRLLSCGGCLTQCGNIPAMPIDTRQPIFAVIDPRH